MVGHLETEPTSNTTGESVLSERCDTSVPYPIGKLIVVIGELWHQLNERDSVYAFGATFDQKILTACQYPEGNTIYVYGQLEALYLTKETAKWIRSLAQSLKF